MSGEKMYGKCEVCGKIAELKRTYFYYGIKCECHSPEHFEIVEHCKECVPTEPKYTTVYMKPTGKRQG